MVSWLVVGASRGIGFGFVQKLSSDSSNHVFAFIRSQTTAGALNELAAQRSNITVVQADLFDKDSLAKAVEEVSAKTGGKLDVLIHNAFAVGAHPMMKPTDFAGKEEELRQEINEAINGNVLGPVYTINAFLPLICRGTEKKIVFISTGAAELDLVLQGGIKEQVGYAASKAAGNIVLAKFANSLADEGIYTLSLSPGWVNTDAAKMFLEAAPEIFKAIIQSFQKVDPSVKGPISVEESVKAQLEVISKLDAKTSGKFLSHRGEGNGWF